MNTILINSGDKFGELTVISLAGKDKHGKQLYLCKCNCGNETLARNYYLKSGRKKSCGCLRKIVSKNNAKKSGSKISKSKFKGIGDLSSTIVGRIKYNADVRKISYEVSLEYLWNLYIQQNKQCALSGIPITFGNRYKKLTTTASLDRIDSSKGYTEGNVQWLHKDTNIMKRQLTNEQFVSFCKAVVNKHEDRSIK